jgi:hypothetical protein
MTKPLSPRPAPWHRGSPPPHRARRCPDSVALEVDREAHERQPIHTQAVDAAVAAAAHHRGGDEPGLPQQPLGQPLKPPGDIASKASSSSFQSRVTSWPGSSTSAGPRSRSVWRRARCWAQPGGVYEGSETCWSPAGGSVACGYARSALLCWSLLALPGRCFRMVAHHGEALAPLVSCMARPTFRRGSR